MKKKGYKSNDMHHNLLRGPDTRTSGVHQLERAREGKKGKPDTEKIRGGIRKKVNLKGEGVHSGKRENKTKRKNGSRRRPPKQGVGPCESLHKRGGCAGTKTETAGAKEKRRCKEKEGGAKKPSVHRERGDLSSEMESKDSGRRGRRENGGWVRED